MLILVWQLIVFSFSSLTFCNTIVSVDFPSNNIHICFLDFFILFGLSISKVSQHPLCKPMYSTICLNLVILNF